MCQLVLCKQCNKKSWAGCGQHLNSIFKNVPVEERCFCGYTKEELDEEKLNPKNKEVGPLPKASGDCIIA